MKIIIGVIILLFGIDAIAQDVGEIKYQYKSEAFPYDSGVAISERQYQFILRNQTYNEITEKTTLPPPKIIIQEKEVRKKGDGNKIIWFLSGATIGVLTGFLAGRK